MDLACIESAVASFYSGSQEAMKAADAALAPARDHPRPWELLQALSAAPATTPAILWCTALVDAWIKRRWRWASADERAACKAALAPLVVSGAAAEGKEAEICAAKMESMLARLLSYDWPEGWPDFFPALLGAALPPAALLRVLSVIGDECLRHGGARRAASVRAALAAQFAPALALIRQALEAAASAGAAAAAATPAHEHGKLALGVLARFAPYLPPAAALDPALLAGLPGLVASASTRSAALQLVGALSALPPEPATDATRHAVLRAALGALHGCLPTERLAATGVAPGWTQTQLTCAAGALTALWKSEAAGETGGAALGLIAPLSDGAAAGGDPEAVAAAFEAAAALAAHGETAAGLAAAALPGLAAARGAATRLLCQCMPRPPEVLAWAEGDGAGDGPAWWSEKGGDGGDDEVDLEEELPGEASADDAEAHRAAAASLGLLMRQGGKAEALLAALAAEIGRAVRRGGAGCARACRATWALGVAAGAAGAAGVAAEAAASAAVAAALSALLGAAQHSAAAGEDARRALAGCACLLVRLRPQAATAAGAAAAGAGAGGEAGAAGVGHVLRALFGWAGCDSEALCRMAGGALAALCAEPSAAAALVQGPEPLLLSILHGLPASLAASPPPEGALLALHAALAAAIRGAVRGACSPAASAEAAVSALLAHADGRWAALAQRPLATAGALVAHAAADAKEASLLCRLYAAAGRELRGGHLHGRLVAMAPVLLGLVSAAADELGGRLQAAAAAGPQQLQHAASSREARALRALRSDALHLLTAEAAAEPAPSAEALRPSLELCGPLLEAMLSRVAQEPPPVRTPALPLLVGALAPALSAAQLTGSIGLLLPSSLEAAQHEEASAAAGGGATAGGGRAGGGGAAGDGSTHGGALLELLRAASRRTDAVLSAAPAELTHSLVALLGWAMGQPPLAPRALTLTHALARCAALRPEHLPPLRAPMRRALAALPDAKDVAALCAEVGLAATGPRASMHARLLGIGEAEFAALAEADDEVAAAEYELFWMTPEEGAE